MANQKPDTISSDGDAPLGRRRLAFGQLSPDEFELLCFYVIAIEHPEVVHIANPDGGADAALPHDDRSWQRCWQAKRFTQTIKWPQCVASFDAAAKTYKMPHYTFCFARDLFVGQEKLFAKHLAGRHPGVVVDWWGPTKLEGILFSSEQGKRIAAQFWGDQEADTRALARAVRAGGELSTGARVLDRLAAIAEHLRERDPFYTYVTVTAETGAPRPGLTPQAVLAVETVESGSSIRVEAIPRPATQPEQLPGVTTLMTAEQAAEFERFLSQGGSIELSGVQVDFQNLPRAFEGLHEGGEEMNVVLRAPRVQPAPWDARFSLDTAGVDAAPIAVHLEPTLEVPADWDAALAGNAGALTATILFRRREDRGQFRVEWSYTDDPSLSARERASQLAFVAGLHRIGKLVITDDAGVRPRLEVATAERELDERVELIRVFAGDLAVIEEWTGRRYPTPGLVPAEEAGAIHEMAQIIRAGGSRMDFSRVVLTMPRSRADEVFRDEENQFLLEVGTGLAVLGTDIPIGRLRGVMRDINFSYADAEEPNDVQVILEPGSEEAGHPWFELVPEAAKAERRADRIRGARTARRRTALPTVGS